MRVALSIVVVVGLGSCSAAVDGELSGGQPLASAPPALAEREPREVPQTDLMFHRPATPGGPARLARRSIFGGGLVEFASELPAPGAGWQLAGAGDFDADGHDDLVWLNSATGAPAIWLLRGYAVVDQGGIHDGRIGVSAPGAAWRFAGVGDIDRDGHDDVIWSNRTSTAVAVWLMDGRRRAGTLSFHHGATGFGLSPAVADYDDNGCPDLVAVRGGRTSLRLLGVGSDGRCTVEVGGRELPARPLEAPIAAADMDSDGDPDVVWVLASGDLGWRSMTGSRESSARAHLLPAIGAGWQALPVLRRAQSQAAWYQLPMAGATHSGETLLARMGGQLAAAGFRRVETRTAEAAPRPGLASSVWIRRYEAERYVRDEAADDIGNAATLVIGRDDSGAIRSLLYRVHRLGVRGACTASDASCAARAALRETALSVTWGTELTDEVVAAIAAADSSLFFGVTPPELARADVRARLDDATIAASDLAAHAFPTSREQQVVERILAPLPSAGPLAVLAALRLVD